MTSSIQEDILKTSGLDALYPVLASMHMTPGWHKKRPSLWKEPRPDFSPMHWRYGDARLALDRAGEWIGTELAERRNFLLFNPVGDNDYATVRTMVVAYQMIKPGEYARSHWHTPNAMRLILDAGPGCYTVVNGTKLPMRTGDFLITPGGCWHSHYNEGKANAYWIDVLDVPLVHLLGPMFWEEDPAWTQQVASEPAAHPFFFPPERVQPLLDAATPDAGMQAIRLDTGGHMPTVNIAMTRLAAGFQRDFGRNTASRIFAAVSGEGTARVGDKTFNWSHGDVFIVPSWQPYQIAASNAAVLFEVSDEPTLQKLGFYRAR